MYDPSSFFVRNFHNFDGFLDWAGIQKNASNNLGIFLRKWPRVRTAPFFSGQHKKYGLNLLKVKASRIRTRWGIDIDEKLISMALIYSKA